jgi:hypothetical protein
MLKRTLLLLFLTALTIPELSFALNYAGRISPEVIYYYLSAPIDVEDTITVGMSAGTTAIVNRFYLDLSTEVMAIPVYDPFTNTIDDGTRSEFSAVLGVFVYESASLFWGYREVMFGESIYSSDFTTQSGTIAGLGLTNLRMGENDQNLFSLNLALLFMETEYENGIGHFDSSDAPGFSVRVGYRRAGTSHGFAMRYQIVDGANDDSQVWPANTCPQEYVTSIQYTYTFGPY